VEIITLINTLDEMEVITFTINTNCNKRKRVTIKNITIVRSNNQLILSGVNILLDNNMKQNRELTTSKQKYIESKSDGESESDSDFSESDSLDDESDEKQSDKVHINQDLKKVVVNKCL
jgi:pantothenate synthetase